MKAFLRHLFIPHEHNNHRAKLLHNRILFSIVTLLFFASLALPIFKSHFPSVLGVSSNISSEELLLLTNQVRKNHGLSPLTLSTELSNAAWNKADDMFLQNYWAHNSPDGKTPWAFIKASGYNYVYAGENLARGFEDTEDVIGAWMASSTHKANILSQNYNEVGFAVQRGRLNGEETVLVVEELGNRNLAFTQAPASANSQAVSGSSVGILPNPLINSFAFSSHLTRGVVFLFIFVLLLDMIVIERKKILRFVGHNIDHIFFLITFLLIVNLLSRGVII